MVRSFQDNVSQDSNSYYILTMVSLVALVVCLSYVSSEKLDANVEPMPKLMTRAIMFRLL